MSEELEPLGLFIVEIGLPGESIEDPEPPGAFEGSIELPPNGGDVA